MAITKTTAAASAATIDLELTTAATYVHPSGMVFRGGEIYTVEATDARDLLGRLDDRQVPVFRKYRKPEPVTSKTRAGNHDAAMTSDEGVVRLPEHMKKGREAMEAEQNAAAETQSERPAEPKVKSTRSTKPAAQVDGDDVDSGEFDSAEGVEV